MTFDVLNIIGIAAFALSGAITAADERYDLLGIFVLGFVTAFGGGTLRNVLLGLPVSLLWEQQMLFVLAFAVISLFLLFPRFMLRSWIRWGQLFDAIGLAAFAIQGAMLAKQAGHSLLAIIVAATLTGSGGGVIRDVLAGRKPLLFQGEIYALWAIFTGLFIGLGLVDKPWEIYIWLILVVFLRMISVRFAWRLPKLKLDGSGQEKKERQ
jgi:uncharacterized membrane protein YeiH